MDASTFLGAFAALIFVLALIVGAAWLARRFRVSGPLLKGNRADARMAVVERLQLDGRHQAVLMRCGQSEHLVVLGPEGTTQLDHRQDSQQ